MTRPRNRLGLFALAFGAACGRPDVAASPAPAPAGPQTPGEAVLYPDVIAAEATRNPDGTWRFDVTLSSPYDSPERYADGWRVLSPSGEELALRVLRHDHASEQPFTRSLDGVRIPEDVRRVTVQGRDQRSGFGGATVTIELERP